MSIKLTDTQLVLLGAQPSARTSFSSPRRRSRAPPRRKSREADLGFIKEVKAKASDPIGDRTRGRPMRRSDCRGRRKPSWSGAHAAEPEDAGEEGAVLRSMIEAAILSSLDAKDARPAEAMEPGPAGPSVPAAEAGSCYCAA